MEWNAFRAAFHCISRNAARNALHSIAFREMQREMRCIPLHFAKCNGMQREMRCIPLHFALHSIAFREMQCIFPFREMQWNAARNAHFALHSIAFRERAAFHCIELLTSDLDTILKATSVT